MPPSRQRDDLLRTRADLFTRMLQGAQDGDTRALHRLRVASRRLRELVPLLQLEHTVARKLGRRLRKVTRRLGAVRELDVLVATLDGLHESGQYHEGGLRRVSADVARHRDAARKRIAVKTMRTELRRIAEKLAAVSSELGASSAPDHKRQETACRWAVDARITRRAEHLTGAMREAGAMYLPERLHAVRVAVKKLRYSLELAAELAGAKQTPDLRTLAHAQDLLGRLHDQHVLIDRVRQTQAAASADIRAERELAAMVDALEDDCRRLHARYVRDRAALADICIRSAARVSAEPPARRAPPRRVAS